MTDGPTTGIMTRKKTCGIDVLLTTVDLLSLRGTFPTMLAKTNMVRLVLKLRHMTYRFYGAPSPSTLVTPERANTITRNGMTTPNRNRAQSSPVV